MTYEEMEWLSNWCLIRGANLLVPHAFYYSVRGFRREERPPQLGPNSPWWGKYQEYADSCRRLSWLNSDSQQVCSIAVLAPGYHIPWQTAKVCFENQHDFNYLEDRHLWEDAVVSDDGIRIAGMHYRLLIVEQKIDDKYQDKLAILENAGRVFYYKPGMKTELLQCMNELTSRSFDFTPAVPALRVRETIKNGQRFLMIFNEECKPVSTTLTISGFSTVTQHDHRTGLETKVKLPLEMNLNGHQLIVISTDLCDE